MLERSITGTRTAYLHVGTYRTASTALQTAIVGHRKALLEVTGVYVPQAGTSSYRSAHHSLARELLSDNAEIAGSPTWRLLSDELSNAPDHKAIVISSEDFSPLFPAVLPVVRRFFQDIGYELIVLVALRNQVDCLNSEYCESIRSGHTTLPVAEFLDRHIVDVRFDYRTQFLHPMMEQGVEFALFSFDRDKSTIVADMLRFISGGTEFVVEERVNKSITAESVYLLRRTPQPLKNMVSSEIYAVERRLGFSTPYFGIAPDLVDLIVSKFSASNDALLARAGLRDDFFFSQKELRSRKYQSEEFIGHSLIDKSVTWAWPSEADISSAANAAAAIASLVAYHAVARERLLKEEEKLLFERQRALELENQLLATRQEVVREAHEMGLRNAVLRKNFQSAKKEIRAMHASRSWRITAPLRKLERLARESLRYRRP